jgi:3-deoxy-manno-octulosonate cytidylyltransferase (CMP-KDO synthetase)
MIPCRNRVDIPFSEDSTPYLRHVGLYAFQRQFLELFPDLPHSSLEQAEKLEQLRVLESGHKIKVVHVAHTFPGVDTKEELIVLHELASTASTLAP